ncbi:MAG: UDP-3-O-(3-hydroxymyristoyl)glucosamine N-acyltransferase [Planctomycetota bacterium]
MKRLGELALLVNGTVSGAPETEVTGAASIKRASGSEITFMNSDKHIDQLLVSDAGAVVVSKTLQEHILAQIEIPVIQVDNAEAAFTLIVAEFRPPVVRKRTGISPSAIISPTARIAEDVHIYPGVFIGDDVEIKSGTTIYPNVTVLERCVIGSEVSIYPSAVLYQDTVVGDRCIIHASAVLGAFGFGYRTREGRHVLSAQLGNVIIEDDVEVGACSTIDRGTYESTIVREGTKIDNQVMIGHNCDIGVHNLLCSQVGVAGSSSTGRNVTMAGQVGVGDHIHVGDEALLHAKAGIMSDVSEKEQLLGAPAMPIRQKMQVLAASMRLPEMRKKMKAMARALEELQGQTDAAQNQPSTPQLSSNDGSPKQGEAA